LPGLLKPSLASVAQKFPRSHVAGVFLLTICLVWTFWLLATIQMGEFSSFRRPLLIALPIGYGLILRFVGEFLAVRALGILCLLAAAPLQQMLMNRVLVIRGGAIGDFILTLPALKALRDAYPFAHIEILGYKHIAALAENRFYAQAVRSIEYGPLASFFTKNSELPAELAAYFASFDLIISYLYDPDGVFESNLRRCGVENLFCGP